MPSRVGVTQIVCGRSLRLFYIDICGKRSIFRRVMTRRKLESVRDSIQANLAFYLGKLPHENVERVREIVASGIAPLFEEEKTRKVVKLVQAGILYRVEGSTNYLDVRMGSNLTREQVEELMRNGITVAVVKNK